MATSLLPPGTTEASSAPITVTEGVIVNLFLTSAAGPVSSASPVYLEFQNSLGTWTAVAVMVPPILPSVTFTGPATFRVRRAALLSAVGVERA